MSGGSTGVIEPRVKEAFFARFAMNLMQEEVAQPILAGENVIISAGTGSGKTEAAMAPLVSRYWQDSLDDETAMPVLYIVPTKAPRQ